MDRVPLFFIMSHSGLYVSPFELLKNTIGGSGYDIACAQAIGPIKFQIIDKKPQWETAAFYPTFTDQLFFIHLEQKQSSEKEVLKYNEMKIPHKEQIVSEISALTREMLTVSDLTSFDKIISAHEDIVAALLGMKKSKISVSQIIGERLNLWVPGEATLFL